MTHMSKVLHSVTYFQTRSLIRLLLVHIHSRSSRLCIKLFRIIILRDNKARLSAGTEFYNRVFFVRASSNLVDSIATAAWLEFRASYNLRDGSLRVSSITTQIRRHHSARCHFDFRHCRFLITTRGRNRSTEWCPGRIFWQQRDARSYVVRTLPSFFHSGIVLAGMWIGIL